MSSKYFLHGFSKSYKIYVAGLNLERARKVMDELRKEGHEITYDWVADYLDHGIEYAKEHEEEAAIAERAAVQASDLLVYLWEEKQESARAEFGMALGIGIPVIAVGEHEAFFYLLPEVHRVEDDAEILATLHVIDEEAAPREQ